MKKIGLSVLFLSLFLPAQVSAVEVAPRISDREIIEKLSRLEEGQKNIDKRFDALQAEMNARFENVDRRFDDLRSEMNARFKAVDDCFQAMDSRFEALDKRIDDLRWDLHLYISISIVILGFVIRMQWQMNKRQAHMEEALETQKDEMKFLKGLIEKLVQPKGVL